MNGCEGSCARCGCLLTGAERAELLGQLAAAAAAIAPPEPWAHPALPAEDRTRPDSLVIRGKSQPLTVTVPERVDPGARYRLVVDLPAAAAPIADAFVVTRTGASVATGPEIARFMQAKYPIDAGKVALVLPPRRHHTHGHARPGAPVATH